MPLSVDITVDVAVDAELYEGRPQTFGIPPEIEGETTGCLFFGEAGDEDPNILFIPVPGPPGPPGPVGDSFDLVLGDDPDTAGTGPWTNGAVPLDPLDSVGDALSLINKKLALIDAEVGNFSAYAVDIPLGDELGTDDVSIWDGGAVPLTPQTTAGEAIAKLNHFLQAHGGGGGGSGGDGFHITLGDVAQFGDGSWSPGAVALADTLPVSEAVDRLNEVLAKLLPSQPPDFPNGALTITNTAGASPRLAAGGVPDNSGFSSIAPGDPVTRITAISINSNTFNDVGPGDTGTLSVIVNAAIVTSHAFTGSNDNGTYGGLVIADQKAFPLTTPGFWVSFDAFLAGVPAPLGINQVKMTHSAAGATGDVFFVRDGMTTAPTVTLGTVVQAAAGVLAYSSGVPHYNTGAQLTVGCSISNLSGETYYGGADPLVVSGTNGIFSTNTLGYAGLGITTPIARQTTAATPITPVTINVDGNVHAAGQLQLVAKNVNGASSLVTLGGATVLVKRGSAGAKVDENAIPVSGLGVVPNNNPAVRKSGLAGVDFPAGTGAGWDSTAAIANTDAVVVGGALKADATDYTTGFLPPGPNLNIAGRLTTQYATFSFQRAAVSVFKINVTGGYKACFVKLVGVTDNPAICPNAVNGWLDATKPYTGAGVPGNPADPSAGCAVGTVMSGSSGSFQITFGTETSSHATNNEILVRFKQQIGHQITALSFSN